MSNTSCCQSCAIPMEHMAPGTEADGSPNSDYCQLCYSGGAFSADLTMDQMIDAWISYMAGPDSETATGTEAFPLPSVVTDPGSAALAGAREDLGALMPTLKRWRVG